MNMTPNGKRIVWMAMAMSNVMMLIALFSIPRAAVNNPALGKALLGVGMALVPLAAALPKLVKAPQAWMAAMAICEGAAVCGILAHAVAGLDRAWMLPVMALVGTGLLFPIDEPPSR
jgi:hypothetical protein